LIGKPRNAHRARLPPQELTGDIERLARGLQEGGVGGEDVRHPCQT